MRNLLNALLLLALLAAPAAAAFALTKVTARVFSPGEASPDVNRARFHFTNDGGEVTIRIFDIKGSLVRRNLDSESAGVMYWNGRDQGGSMVKGGIYIYQIEAGEQVITGTVVVAK
ncbi:MAG: hypothetical protein AB7V08_10140 [Elusimicrobiales bacterium]